MSVACSAGPVVPWRGQSIATLRYH